MACTRDVCWSNAAELFYDADFDLMYSRQQQAMCGRSDGAYPYALLVYTGKITIAINLDESNDCRAGSLRPSSDNASGIESGRHNRAPEDITE
jgi:hypothetical protein